MNYFVPDTHGPKYTTQVTLGLFLADIPKFCTIFTFYWNQEHRQNYWHNKTPKPKVKLRWWPAWHRGCHTCGRDPCRARRGHRCTAGGPDNIQHWSFLFFVMISISQSFIFPIWNVETLPIFNLYFEEQPTLSTSSCDGSSTCMWKIDEKMDWFDQWLITCF